MLDTTRYAYHLTTCEKMIKKNKYYELNKRHKWHRRKLKNNDAYQ